MALPSPCAQSTALVTGASGGIGAEIARDLSARGHHVTLVARSAEKLHALAEELGNADVAPCDLGDRAARADLIAGLLDGARAVEILVNNAGWSTLGRVSQADPAAELGMLEVDVATVVDLCTRLTGPMAERGRGAVLNVASTAAFQPLPGQAGYGAAKAFVLSYTQSLHAELKPSGVSVTALCPGPVDTGFGERAGFSKQDAEEALPAVMWVSARDVAAAGVHGLDRGRRVVIPGRVNRVAAHVAQVAPRRMLLPMLAKGHPGLR